MKEKKELPIYRIKIRKLDFFSQSAKILSIQIQTYKIHLSSKYV
jgi:hypothetical protein